MYLYGSFPTLSGDTVTVHIVTGNNRATKVEIGDEKGGVFFTTNPVEIESSVNDTFDHLLRSQATIRLLTRDFIPDLFRTSCMDAAVNIFKEDKCVFAGFIEPQTYSQSYNELYDELEITCIDVLSALQYSKYREAGSLGKPYAEIKAEADQRPFLTIVREMIGRACADLDITGTRAVRLLYDGSKCRTESEADRYGIFSQLGVSELLFLGEEEDNVWSQDDVLNEIMQYLNLHIEQEGFDFRIFSWESVKGDSPVIWCDLLTGEADSQSRKDIEISLDNVSDADTTISIGEVFNRIEISCRVEDVDSVIKSPLERDDLTSPYTDKQLYMTEYSAEGEGVTAFDSICAMTHDQPTDYDSAVITDWYIQVKDNPQWEFNLADVESEAIRQQCQEGKYQHFLPNALGRSPGAAIVSFGSIAKGANRSDNSLVSKIDMTDYMVISVNGNGIDNDKDGTTYPNEESLMANAPCAVYKGAVSGGVYSPSDDQTTNYIVFSGNLILNPVMAFTGSYKDMRDSPDRVTFYVDFWHKTVPSRDNEYGRYYTQKYYKAATPGAAPEWDRGTHRGLVPFTGKGPQEYEFRYSAIGDGSDKVSKIAVLACMLVIGDKCLVETDSEGKITDFKWLPYKTREQCKDDDEYYAQCFTIGFDPKIGDSLIGTSFSMQNNISHELGIEASGTAIPIHKDDRLSGRVSFQILGPVNTTWGDISRRHPTWFRHTKWTENTVPLMAHVSSIFIKNFEVKIYSDNGLVNNTDDNDLIYMSNTQEGFVNCKDDIEFKINSALTKAERRQLGITDSVKLSTPIDFISGYGVQEIYDANILTAAKPEQIYVDSYYREYHRPRVIMEQKIYDRETTVNRFWHYTHPAMGKTFFVQGISRNLIEGSAQLTLKEIDA